MAKSTPTIIDYIITDDYEAGIAADKMLKSDHMATITAFKPMM